jgi:hypothetical protein
MNHYLQPEEVPGLPEIIGFLVIGGISAFLTIYFLLAL